MKVAITSGIFCHKDVKTPKQAYEYIKQWMQTNIHISDQEKFQEYAETELLALHEGNFARYQIRPSEFEVWQTNWKKHH